MNFSRAAIAIGLATCLAVTGLVFGPQVTSSDAQNDACTALAGTEGCWQIKLFDDFDGDQIDRTVWEPGWYVDDGFSVSINGSENACYHTRQVTVADGSLQIRLDSIDDPACLDKQGDVVDLVGGAVSSRDARADVDHLGRLDGDFYVEARVRTPTLDGALRNWPAFWTTGFGPWPETGEIDILEVLRGQAKYNFHYECPQGGNCQAGATVHPAASNDGGWHTYGAMRRVATAEAPATITWFFDGQPVGTLAENVVDSPHYIIFTHTSHESHNTTMTGETLVVDWVRSWSLVDPVPGDVDCSLDSDLVDALAIVQYAAGLRSDAPSCPLADASTQLYASGGDMNADEVIDIADALIIARCAADLPQPSC